MGIPKSVPNREAGPERELSLSWTKEDCNQACIRKCQEFKNNQTRSRFKSDQ